MKKSSAKAVWNGPGKDGKGTLTTDTLVLKDTPFNYVSRFENGTDTNPEELVAAAHAGCFSMKLSFVLGAAGFTPEQIDTKCTISLDNGAITESHLVLSAKVPGISQEVFDASVKDAKENCPISKLLHTNITLESTLVS
jgi:osmotically inducible protein OsmC